MEEAPTRAIPVVISVNPVRNNDSTGTGAVRCTTRDARIENRMI